MYIQTHILLKTLTSSCSSAFYSAASRELQSSYVPVPCARWYHKTDSTKKYNGYIKQYRYKYE